VDERWRAEVLDVRLRARPAEGAGHPLLAIGRGDLRMAEGARLLVDVAGRGPEGDGKTEAGQVAGDEGNGEWALWCGRLRSLPEEQEG
jgi:hypothetical protein